MNKNDPFDFSRILKNPSYIIGFIYIYVSVIGFLYILISKSELEINLFNYYELTDFLLIGIKNFKILLVSINVILLFNIFFTAFFTYLIRKYRPTPYGQALDMDSSKYIIIESLSSAFKSLLRRSPIIIFLVLSLVMYKNSTLLMIVFMGLGILAYLFSISKLALTEKEVYLDDTGVKILIYSIILIGLMTGIAMGYFERNNPPNMAEIRIENEVIKGDIIGTTNKYIFLKDSSVQILNKDLIKSIHHLEIESFKVNPNFRNDTINSKSFQ